MCVWKEGGGAVMGRAQEGRTKKAFIDEVDMNWHRQSPDAGRSLTLLLSSQRASTSNGLGLPL